MNYHDKLIKNLETRIAEELERIENPSGSNPVTLWEDNYVRDMQGQIEKLNAAELIFPPSYVIENPNIIDAVKKAFKTLTFNFCFTGRAGVGKTYLMRIVKGGVYNCGLMHKTNSINCIEDYDQYLKARRADSTYHPDTKCQFLFIDDVGDEKPSTDAAHSWIAGIIQERYEYWSKHPECSTIITTNLPTTDLITIYGERVVDRMLDQYTFCKFTNDSFRLRNQKVIEG